MKEIKVEITVEVPDDVTDEEISKYLDFVLGINGSIETVLLNKFGNDELEAMELRWWKTI